MSLEQFAERLMRSVQYDKYVEPRIANSFLSNVVQQDDSAVVATLFQRYGRDPREVRKYDNPMSRTSRFTRRRDPHQAHRETRQTTDGANRLVSFEETRRRRLCFNCKQPCTPAHSHQCTARRARLNARGRLVRGESHVHVVQEQLPTPIMCLRQWREKLPKTQRTLREYKRSSTTCSRSLPATTSRRSSTKSSLLTISRRASPATLRLRVFNWAMRYVTYYAQPTEATKAQAPYHRHRL